MTTDLPQVEPEGLATVHTPTQSDRIGWQVLRMLGRPPQLVRLQVRALWGSYYRVNVFVGANVISASISNSYFVTVDDKGTILVASPTIQKAY